MRGVFKARNYIILIVAALLLIVLTWFAVYEVQWLR